MKTRLDILLVERGLAPSRERAQAMILAGRVLVDEQKIEKPGHAVAEDCSVRLLGSDQRYVSRGGLKLEAALAHWKIALEGAVCMDVGASTGGFTDCLLQHGAAKVVAIDTGYGQIDARLRADSRVRLLEKTNARYLEPEQVPEPVELVAMDVSFISATQVLPAVVRAAFGKKPGVPGKPGVPMEPAVGSMGWKPAVGLLGGKGQSLHPNEPTSGSLGTPHRRELVLLIKPQFEVGRERVGKGGIVRSEEARQEAVARVREAVAGLGGCEIEVIDSPILGTEGNREFLLHSVF